MIDAGKLYDSCHIIYSIWLITYDSFDFYDSCILVDIRMDIIWQWLQFILIAFAHSLVFKKKYSCIHIIHDSFSFFTKYLT